MSEVVTSRTVPECSVQSISWNKLVSHVLLTVKETGGILKLPARSRVRWVIHYRGGVA